MAIKALLIINEHIGPHCGANTLSALELDSEIKVTTSANIPTNIYDYDVLVMPGGDGGHAYLDHFSSDEENRIKDFVSKGGGYFGTCAGAYFASSEVIEQNGTLRYKGLGIAPNIKSRVLTDNEDRAGFLWGTNSFGKGGVQIMSHYAGPAMIASGNAQTYCSYNDKNITASYKYGAIVEDTYGTGKVILCGPHPELDPKDWALVRQMTKRVAKGSSDGGNTMTSFTINEITDAGKRVTAFIETNKRLPTTCKVGTMQLNMAEFLYLAVNVAIDYGKITKVDYKTLKEAPAPTGTYKEGTITIASYKSVATNIRTHMVNNGNAPNYATIANIGTVPTNDLIYAAGRVLNFINTNKRLPTTVAIKKITTGTTPTPTSDIVQRVKDETGKSFNNYKELYALVVKYGRYCNPMYMDNQKSFNQAQVCVINEFNGIWDPNAYVQSPISGQWTQRDCMTCVDWAQWGAKMAMAMGYEAIVYGVYCPVYEINHAIFTIRGKEFSDWTVIDLAAAAAEGYSIGSHWCNAPTADRKEPSWVPYE